VEISYHSLLQLCSLAEEDRIRQPWEMVKEEQPSFISVVSLRNITFIFLISAPLNNENQI